MGRDERDGSARRNSFYSPELLHKLIYMSGWGCAGAGGEMLKMLSCNPSWKFTADSSPEASRRGKRKKKAWEKFLCII